jgi:hypothetical protein
VTVFPIEEVACRVAVDLDDPVGATLRRETRVAVENAERDTETVDRRRVRCTDEQAGDLLEFFDRAAAALEERGEYERSTACAQAAELIRRGLRGRVAT